MNRPIYAALKQNIERILARSFRHSIIDNVVNVPSDGSMGHYGSWRIRHILENETYFLGPVVIPLTQVTLLRDMVCIDFNGNSVQILLHEPNLYLKIRSIMRNIEDVYSEYLTKRRVLVDDTLIILKRLG